MKQSKQVIGAEDPIEWFSPEELEKARELYLAEQDKEKASPQIKFRYAIALAKSNKRDDKYRGISLLEDLVDEGFEPKDCLYWIALTFYGLGEYRTSRSYCERLLRIDPTHQKALLLHDCIKDMVAKDGMMGLGIMSAVVVAGIAIKYLMMKR